MSTLKVDVSINMKDAHLTIPYTIGKRKYLFVMPLSELIIQLEELEGKVITKILEKKNA